MKKFLLPLQNMVRADLFSGSLVVLGVRGEDRIPFELFQEYTVKIENWNRKKK